MVSRSNVDIDVEDRWDAVLAYRGERAAIRAVRDRFAARGIEPATVASVLDDCGEQLYRDSMSGRENWADAYGGHLAVALLAAEVAAFSSHLVSRAAAVRAHAVDTLLDEVSAVTLAAELGVSRQKVYEIGRAGSRMRAQRER